MSDFEDKQKSFNFEERFCFENVDVWINEARGLFHTAQILIEFNMIQIRDFFSEEKRLKAIFSDEICSKAFFNHRIIRMLWGYGFENLLKGLMMLEMKQSSASINTVPFEKIKTHDLLKLFQNVGIKLNSDQIFYVGIMQKCSVWMGRYPLPVKSAHMYDKRKSMNSSEELFERNKTMYELVKNGEIERMESESDILQGGIGQDEYAIVAELIRSTLEAYEIHKNEHVAE